MGELQNLFLSVFNCNFIYFFTTNKNKIRKKNFLNYFRILYDDLRVIIFFFNYLLVLRTNQIPQTTNILLFFSNLLYRTTNKKIFNSYYFHLIPTAKTFFHRRGIKKKTFIILKTCYSVLLKINNVKITLYYIRIELEF